MTEPARPARLTWGALIWSLVYALTTGALIILTMLLFGNLWLSHATWG